MSEGRGPESGGGPVSSEAQLAAVLESISDGFYALDADWRYVIFNRAAEAYFGVSAERLLGRRMWDVFPQGIGTEFERACRAAMDRSEVSTFRTPSRLRPDRTVDLRIAPMPGGGVCVSLTDVTDRVRAENRSTEILESIGDAFYAVDADWRFTYVNRVAEAWWGLQREDLIGRPVWEALPQTVGGVVEAALRQAAETRERVRIETVSPVVGHWVDVAIHPTADGGISVFLRDIGERKRNEAARELLMREVDHRARNVLTVAQAVVQLTQASDMAAYKQTVVGRIGALARAQGSLASRRWEGALLSQVLAEELATVGPPGSFDLAGPDQLLSPEQVQPLSMIFHELATNALKFGAFAQAGRVAVSWDLDPDGALRLAWRESAACEAPPRRLGFGSKLIGELARQLGGEVRFDWRDTGVVVHLRAPRTQPA
ncbi:MAG: sensor histidine kinase [Phenylobacterium sp.]|uniref:sensor histidine kinase n=1 Tax=Phenylobacterium sp. TaxID=1871053 RepID=UPI003918B200